MRAIDITHDRSQLVDAVLDAIADHPDVYAIGERPSRIVRVHGGHVHELDAPGLTDVASRCATFFERGKNEPKLRALTEIEARAVLSRPDRGRIRKLTGIVRTPQLTAGGRLIATPGYDPVSGIIYAPQGASNEINPNPTRDDALAAYDRLAELFCDFEFMPTREWGTAAAISAILTLLSRHAFEGPAPMFVLDASLRGAGKGLAAEIIGQIGHGTALTSVPEAPPSEQHKQIVSWFLAGTSTVLIDNVQKPLGGAPLNVLLTQDPYGGRTLGKSQFGSYANKLTVLATGNNVRAADGDTRRRMLLIRQEPSAVNLADRTFRFPNLKAYVREHKERYTRDALTILLAYAAAGRPMQKTQRRDSYETWSEQIAAPLVWLGKRDPFERRADDDEEISESDEAAERLLDGVITAFGDAEVASAQAADEILDARRSVRMGVKPTKKAVWHALGRAIDEHFEASHHGQRAPEDMTATRVGYALRALSAWRVRDADKVRVVARTSHGQRLWKVERATLKTG